MIILDNPQYDFPHQLLEHQHSKLWLHCKNLEAVSQFNILDPHGSYLNYFWHQEDDVTLTSKGHIWAYPGKQPIENSIARKIIRYRRMVDTPLGLTQLIK